MPLPQALSPDELNNVAFEDCLNANGAVAADSFATWNNDNPATYTPGSGSAFKWGGGAAGTPGGTVRYDFDPGAYWLMWNLRRLMPRHSQWRVAQFDTLRLRLIKSAVRIEVLKTQVRLHLPRATPDQALFALLLTRMPRLSI